MKRRIQGLRDIGLSASNDTPDGVYLVRVDRAQFHWHACKPFYTLRLTILEPRELAGRTVSGRLECTSKALWKLGWFLRDFLYDPELLSRDEVDERSISGLRGAVKISHAFLRGATVLQFDGFAPASQWPDLSSSAVASAGKNNGSEMAR
jgi:hypothetical protein